MLAAIDRSDSSAVIGWIEGMGPPATVGHPHRLFMAAASVLRSTPGGWCSRTLRIRSGVQRRGKRGCCRAQRYGRRPRLAAYMRLAALTWTVTYLYSVMISN